MTTVTGNSYLDTMAAARTTAASAAANKSGTLDQSSFLKLMTTQLKTQDPTAPTDNTQMIAQMAQFSQVAGVAEMNASLKAVLSELQTSRMGDAASWIGRSALVPSKTAMPLSDGGYAGRVTLPEDTTSGTLRLLDSNNAVVYSQAIGARAAGDVAFAWDGKNAAGAAVPGPLRIEVAAKGANGTVAATTAAWTGVTGVQSPAGGSATKLITDLGRVAPADTLSLS